MLYENYLKDHPAPEDCEYYMCGPPMMNAAVIKTLLDLGVERDDIRAFEWYLRSAMKGHPGAQSGVGWYYEIGRGMPAPDLIRAYMGMCFPQSEVILMRPSVRKK